MVVVVLPALLLGYTNLLTPSAPRRASPSSAASPFLGLGLATHDTGLDAEQQCSAEVLPTSFDVAAPPRVLPKRATPGGGGGDDAADPLGLWSKPPGGPKGPSVFTLNQGRAIDLLRHDYPRLFSHKPDLSIFTSGIELHDPSGHRLRGLNQYEKVFDMLRFLRRTTMQDASVTYRLVVADGRIRVRWTAKLWMRDPVLGVTKMANGEPAVVHLDGVSIYGLDDEGKVCKHTIENIVLRGTEAEQPVQLALAWPSLGRVAAPELALPSFPYPFFRALDVSHGWAPPQGLSSLFEAQPLADAPPTRGASAAGVASSASGPARSTQQASRAARASKPRAGVPRALAEGPADETPMQRAARERAEDAEKARRLAELRAPKESERKGGLFGSMPQPCDTSYDCERPQVCCDLLFGSVCCNGGLMIPTTDGQPALQRQAIPIPVERDNGGLPPGMRPPPTGPP